MSAICLVVFASALASCANREKDTLGLRLQAIKLAVERSNCSVRYERKPTQVGIHPAENDRHSDSLMVAPITFRLPRAKLVGLSVTEPIPSISLSFGSDSVTISPLRAWNRILKEKIVPENAQRLSNILPVHAVSEELSASSSYEVLDAVFSSNVSSVVGTRDVAQLAKRVLHVRTQQDLFSGLGISECVSVRRFTAPVSGYHIVESSGAGRSIWLLFDASGSLVCAVTSRIEATENTVQLVQSARLLRALDVDAATQNLKQKLQGLSKIEPRDLTVALEAASLFLSFPPETDLTADHEYRGLVSLLSPWMQHD